MTVVITEILPHREPFLLIDEILEVTPGVGAVARKTVREGEWYLRGHFPGRPIMPGVLIGGRKVAGILAESSEGRVVLGIGVNVNQTAVQLLPDARTEPTSLRLELGEAVNRGELLAAILLRLERAYDAWLTTGTSASG